MFAVVFRRGDKQQSLVGRPPLQGHPGSQGAYAGKTKSLDVRTAYSVPLAPNPLVNNSSEAIMRTTVMSSSVTASFQCVVPTIIA